MPVLCDYTVVHAGRVVIGNGSNPNTSAANNRVLADSELDAVSGGARTDPGDDDDKMSGGELSALWVTVY
jgi:hypothetical protein